jgi:putative flippase GtrA
VLAFVTAVANNWFWNARWTFAGHGVSPTRSAVCFAVVSVAGLVVDLLVLHTLVDAGVPPVAAQVAGVAAATPLTYAGNRMWTFRRRPRAAPSQLEAALPTIVVAWAVSRVLVLATAAVVQTLRWPRTSWYATAGHRPFVILQAWDARWYRVVAARGYLDIPHHQSDTAFFPLFPALMNALRTLGLSSWTSGLLLANLGLFAALVAVHELAATWLPEAAARRAAVYVALLPIGYVFSMAYPESLVLAAMAGAGAAAVRRRWAVAAALAAVAAAGRPEGVFVAIPLVVLAVRAGRDEQPAALAAAASAPAALAAVAAYQRLIVGDPIAFSHAQVEWGRHFSPLGIGHAFVELAHAGGNNLWLVRDATFAAVYVVLLIVARRNGVPWPWIVSGLAIVLLPLETGSFTSDARFGLLALPVYAGLARLGESRYADIAIRGTMVMLLVGGTATILDRWP